MNKKLLCIVVFILCICNISTNAQNSAPPVNLFDVAGSKSPEVASLSKFGNVPVSYSTGVPSISIPIYDIKISDISVPVSLAYHAGGIRVDETASSIGLGWALNAGGAISRSMIGMSDESTGGYLLSPDYATATSLTGETSLAYAYRFRSGNAEVSADVFSYDIGGIHGKFTYKRTGNGRTFLQFPMTNNRIERLESNTGLNFKITDSKGIQYHFEEKEEYQTGLDLYIGSWRLSKIISSSLADTVYFKYEKANSFLSSLNTSSNFIIGTTVSCGGSKSPIFGGGRSTSATSSIESYLSEISWRSGKIKFDLSNDRLDYPGGRRVTGITLFNRKNNTFSILKKVSLYHSHFNSVLDSRNLTANDSRNFRLKLDSVFVKDANDADVKPYRLTYNNSPFAPKDSFAQDIFGFNNAAWGNDDPFPRMQTYHTVSGTDGQATWIGSADREVKPEAMKAGILTGISYPTGGKTTFDFEAHKFETSGPSQGVIPHSYNATISGGNGVLSTVTTFVYSEAMNQQLTFRASFSPYAGLANEPSYARIYDVTANSQVVRINTIGYSTTGYDTGRSLYGSTGYPALIAGHTYRLEAYIFSDAIGLRANIELNWVTADTSTVGKTRYGGGLRISKITDYDTDNKFISSKRYEYGSNGNGILLTPPEYLGYNEESTLYMIGCTNELLPAECRTYVGDRTYILRQSSVLPLSQFSGSPIMYNSVTEYQVDGQGASGNGKSVFGFNILQDNNAFPTTDYKATGIALISNSWKNGLPGTESHYKLLNGQYLLVSSKEHKYTFSQKDLEPTIFIKSKYTYSGCGFTDQAQVWNDFVINGYSVPSGIMQLDSVINKVIEQSGTSTSKESYLYTNTDNYNPSSKTIISSEGFNETENYLYPTNVTTYSPVYAAMVTKNIIDPVIQLRKTLDGRDTHITNTLYDSFHLGNLLAPKSIETQNGPFGLEQHLVVNDYDQYGNILDQQLNGGIHNSYIWGYQSAYPVAELKNALATEVFFEDFEQNDNATVSNSHTGLKGYVNSSYGINWTRPNSRSYAISYWFRQSGEWKFSGSKVYPGSYTLTGGDAYDDILIQPADSEIQTFTYEPLVGVTSKIDGSNNTTYFEYDNSQRLINIKDHNGFITKNFRYNYGTNADDSTVPVLFYNTSVSQSFTRNNCEPGAIAGSVIYTVNAGTYSSSSQAGAQALANQDLLANGQAYANTHADCGSPTIYFNTEISQSFLRNNCPEGYTPGSATYTVPAGTYSASTQQEAQALAQQDIVRNGRLYANANATCTAPGSCNGPENKLINGVCVTGQKKYTSSVLKPDANVYVCTYHYEWSDGSRSENYQETHTEECFLN